MRVGIGRLDSSGKTSLLGMVCKVMKGRYELVVITNDIHAKKDQRLLTVNGALSVERIMRVGTGGCSHTAIREGVSVNLEAIDRMVEKFPNTDVVFIKSDSDNLAAKVSPELSHLTIYVIGVATGEKISHKASPGITKSDLLVINKTDLAPFAGANLDVITTDTIRMHTTTKGLGPFVMTNLKTSVGLAKVRAFVESKGRLQAVQFVIFRPAV